MDMALSFFLRLTLGHLIGDFVLQPYWLVLAKRKGWSGLIIHVGVVAFFTAIVAWNAIPHWWAWIIVLYLGHLFIDQFRTFVFVDNTKGKGLLLLIVDQIAHIILILFITWEAVGWPFSNWSTLIIVNNQYKMIVYLMGVATVIGVVPVLEIEITVAVWAAQGRETAQIIAITSVDRILGGLERITAMLLIMLGLGILAPLMFLPRLALMIYQEQATLNRTAVTTKVLTSFGTAMIIGYLLYYVPVPTLSS